MSDKNQNKFSRERFPTVNLDYGGARKKTWDELADEIERGPQPDHECRAPGCGVQIFDPKEDFCQHHEANRKFGVE